MILVVCFHLLPHPTWAFGDEQDVISTSDLIFFNRTSRSYHPSTVQHVYEQVAHLWWDSQCLLDNSLHHHVVIPIPYLGLVLTHQLHHDHDLTFFSVVVGAGVCFHMLVASRAYLDGCSEVLLHLLLLGLLIFLPPFLVLLCLSHLFRTLLCLSHLFRM